MAGFVDAIGFLGTGGFFVSFMSGNSTRLGVGFVDGAGAAVMAAGLVGSFVGGVMIASLLKRKVRSGKRSFMLLLVSLLLSAGAICAGLGLPTAAFALAAAAMGAENMVFEDGGEVQIGLTYMTGALVKIGQRLALALSGGSPWSWLPFLLLWIGLITGGAMGALCFFRWGMSALWIAAGLAGLLAIVVGPDANVSKARG
ncbi:uncharacterized membrane protein YoaK (UPF0700 family) [Sphingobium boeckii]|uniref:Uncharacterized membrane protein YoaK (UPF0700 family) n=1 Tax=Sphingobium boeckii TaxID=1082345 RepID=A0A7W9ED22_9SPHN|nr:uncharacterized membrane protein YoaK (UPF0700 family) [Sphingobium boeckii]